MDVRLIFEYRKSDLKKLGFNDYASYLQSKLWKSIRERVFARDMRVCCMCHAKAEQVHHKRYDSATLEGKDLSQLFSLCRDCHEAIEFDNGRKRPYWEVYQITRHIKSSKPRAKRVIETDPAQEKLDAAIRTTAIDRQRRKMTDRKDGGGFGGKKHSKNKVIVKKKPKEQLRRAKRTMQERFPL